MYRVVSRAFSRIPRNVPSRIYTSRSMPINGPFNGRLMSHSAAMLNSNTENSLEMDTKVIKQHQDVERELSELQEDLMTSADDLYLDRMDSEQAEGKEESESKELEVAANDEELPERYYFDTQKIYTSLKYAGFTDGQADAVMLTITDFMLKGLTEVQEHSIPQWAAENEAYLFEAACSEIRNDIQTARQDQAEQYRGGISWIQRELEALQHESNEIIQSLKTDMEMEINERKDSTRAEENAIELRIQELNNKITIDINSDAKSDIEALRWQTTRRGLTGIIVAAGCILLVTVKKKDNQKPVKPIVTRMEEYRVPVLQGSELEEPDEIKAIDSLK